MHSAVQPPEKCAICGLADPTLANKLHSPFLTQPFDFSANAYETAERIIEEGDSKLALLEEAVQRLSAYRDDMKLAVQQHHSLVAPVNRLLEDTLLLVFEQVSEADVDGKWRISAVCKRWRDLIISQSRFWADISLQPDDMGRSATIQRMCDRAELQITRSSSCPLNVTLDLSEATEIRSKRIRSLVKETTRNLLANSHRLSKLQLDGDCPTRWKLTLPPSLHSLKKLSIEDPRWLKSIQLSIAPVVLDAPNLTDITLIAMELTSELCRSLNWKILQALKLVDCDCTAATLLETLRLSRSLRSIEIVAMDLVSTPAFGTVSQALPVDLPALVYANFTVEEGDSYAPILRHIGTPQLNHLQLGSVSVGADFLSTQRALLASSANRCLQTLDLDFPVICSELVSLLESLDALQVLNLKIRGWNDHCSLLQALVWQGTASEAIITSSGREVYDQSLRQGICPNLTRMQFVLGGIETEPAWSHLLESIVRSRARTSLAEIRTEPPCFLEEVIVQNLGTGRPANLKWLRVMEAECLVNTHKHS